MTTSAWSVVAVDTATGANPTTLAGVAINGITWVLNDMATCDLELRSTDAAVAEFRDDTREVQVWRDGTVMFWGPAVRVEIDNDRCRVQCTDPFWYLTRRFFGRADRVNWLTNGDFEDGVTGWTAEGLTPIVDPQKAVQGQTSVRLAGTSAGHNTYLHQTYTHSQVHPAGDQLTIAAHVWVANDDYQGEAFADIGLLVERRDGSDTLLDTEYATIDSSTPHDEWARLEVTLDFVQEGDTVEVRLYPPYGTANFDLVTLTHRESLSFVEQDMATIIRGIVAYAQDQFPGFTHGKSDVALAVDVDPTGVTLSRTYEFSDHENIADALRAFTEQRNGVDWAVEIDATTRTLVVSHPERGTTHGDLTLEWGVNVTSFRWSSDRTQQAHQVVVLGPGDGPDREEGSATTTATGPTLEDVTVAPDGTVVGDLDRAATERLAVVTHPEILDITCVGLLGQLTVGDWVPVDLPTVEDTYRITQITVDPANDSLSLICNLRDPQTPEEAMARFPRAVDACTDGAGGVWVVGSDGGVGAYNGADFHGSLPDDAIIPNAPIVAIVPHGTGGYWLVGADTGIFAYGDAPARLPYEDMVDSEYAQGDRAIIGAEPYDPGGDDTLIMLADDGAYYIGATPP